MKSPLKARLSQLRQRIVLTIRWYLRPLYRLPIDDIREQHRERLDKQFAETLQNVAAIMNQLNSRLRWYETRIPTIRKEYLRFLAKQKKLMEAEKARQDEFNELVAGGMPEAVAREKVWPRPPQQEPASDDAVVGAIDHGKSDG